MNEVAGVEYLFIALLYSSFTPTRTARPCRVWRCVCYGFKMWDRLGDDTRDVCARHGRWSMVRARGARARLGRWRWRVVARGYRNFAWRSRSRWRWRRAAAGRRAREIRKIRCARFEKRARGI